MTSDDFEVGDSYEKPLIPAASSGGQGDVVFDESGELGLAGIGTATLPNMREPGRAIFNWRVPCGLGVLDGSWSISIRPQLNVLFGSLRGPMRIEANADVLRVSGDAYFAPWKLKQTLASTGPAMINSAMPINKASFIKHWKLNWYPHFPFNEYVWYFRSTGATYSNGELFFSFTRHLWDKATQEFASTDQGWMRFPCSTSVLVSTGFLQPTVKMNGTAMIGGSLHAVTASKTSPYYRGCVVEVDVMANRSWPGTPGGQSFTGTFRGDGLDVRMYINETDVPEDNSLTDAECNALMGTHRAISAIGHTWRIWTLVGSRRSGQNTFGLIFDTSGAVQREGCVSYTDATFDNGNDLDPSIRGERLGDVPLGHLRTLIHEVGHCLNLQHPAADDHNPPDGETIMNQTGVVRGFAAPGNLYPSNAEFGFNDHNRTSLIHSPDPQIAPGWLPFGWGHWSSDPGVPVPTDVVGLRRSGFRVGGLTLTLDLPDAAAIGEFVTAKVELHNDGGGEVQVNDALNLAQGQLEFRVRDPQGSDIVVHDVVHLCGPNNVTGLDDKESISGVVQLFYTNRGHTFTQPGSYYVYAVYRPYPGASDQVVSPTRSLEIQMPTSAPGRRLAELTMDDAVGLSFAFGDFGTNDVARDKLQELSADFADNDTGTAAALVLANSFARPFRDLRSGAVARKSNTREVNTAMGRAMRDVPSDRVAELATAVVASADIDAPVLAEVRQQLAGNKRSKGGKAAANRAIVILDHFGKQ